MIMLKEYNGMGLNLYWDKERAQWVDAEDYYSWYPGMPEPKPYPDLREKLEKVPGVHDSVNSPPHYAEGRKYEPIDVIEDWHLNYHLATALKYISRVGRKKDAVEDIKKAVWFLNRELKRRGA